MPFIRSLTSCPVSDAQALELEKGLAEMLETITGKPRSALAVQFLDRQRLHFAGSADRRSTVLEIAVAGRLSKQEKQALVAAGNALYAEVIGCSPADMYVVFSEIARENWGVRGGLLS